MKFAVFALIAGLCLIAGAHADAFEQPQEIDIEFLSQDLADGELDVDFESFGLWTGIYWISKGALRTLKRINCSLKAVELMRLAAVKFISDVENCGGEVSKQVQTLVNQCKAIIQTCNNIFNVNNNVCNNADWQDQSNNNSKTGWNCFWKLLKQMLTLKNQIKKALSMITKLPKVGTNAGTCTSNAAIELTKPFTNFPAYVKTCSKLTSN